MTDFVYFLLYLALGKLSLMLLINYLSINYNHYIIIFYDHIVKLSKLNSSVVLPQLRRSTA